ERFVGRAVPRVLLPDFNYGLKPNQLQQQAIYDDEQARARRAAMAKLGFAVVRQMPTTAHGGFRPVTPQGKPLAAARPKPAGKSNGKVAARSGGNGAKPRGPAPTRVRVAASVRVPAAPRATTASRVVVTPRVASPTRIVPPARPITPVRAASPARTAARPSKPATRSAARPKPKAAARSAKKKGRR